MSQTTAVQEQPIVLSNPSASQDSEDIGFMQRVQSIADKVEKQGLAAPVEGGKPIEQPSDVPPDAMAAVKTTAAAVKVLFPKIGTMLLNLGLNTKDRYLAELRKDAKAAEELQHSMKLLIELSGQLTPIGKDQEEIAITEKIKDYAARLKDKGFDIFKDSELETTKTLTRERIADVKFLIGNFTDMQKTQLQNIFTTQIQPKITELNSILDCFKTIEKYLDRLNSGIVANQLPR
jgi:hypothetical protein